jgi:hypothetical protein
MMIMRNSILKAKSRAMFGEDFGIERDHKKSEIKKLDKMIRDKSLRRNYDELNLLKGDN